MSFGRAMIRCLVGLTRRTLGAHAVNVGRTSSKNNIQCTRQTSLRIVPALNAQDLKMKTLKICSN